MLYVALYPNIGTLLTGLNPNKAQLWYVALPTELAGQLVMGLVPAVLHYISVVKELHMEIAPILTIIFQRFQNT